MQRCFESFRPLFDAAGVEADLPVISGQQLSAAELEHIIDVYDGVIAGDDMFTRAVLERGTSLRVISKWGVGLDSIDREAARELGILVTNTPNMFDDEVADVTIGYLIMLSRGLHLIDRAVRSGDWRKIEGRSLAGRTLGVVGLGGIGRATVRRGVAMGMLVCGADPSTDAAEQAAALGAEVVSFEVLVERSDAIALNCPLTEQTRGMVDAAAFARARDGVLVVNTARGPVIEELSLIDALQSGKVGGAALDVFEEEPLALASPLRDMEQVILGSHNGSNTREAVLRTSACAVANLLNNLAG